MLLSFRRRHRANCHNEINRRHIARILDPMLVIGGGKGYRTRAESALFAVDRELYRAFLNQPKFAMCMAMRWMWSAAWTEFGLVNFHALSCRRSAVHDAARLRDVVHLVRMHFFKGKCGGT